VLHIVVTEGVFDVKGIFTIAPNAGTNSVVSGIDRTSYNRKTSPPKIAFASEFITHWMTGFYFIELLLLCGVFSRIYALPCKKMSGYLSR
jgi:hypothetical protein